MKKEEVTGILQNEFVFDRLSGSAGRSGPIRGLSMMKADYPAIICSCHAILGWHPLAVKVFLNPAAVR